MTMHIVKSKDLPLGPVGGFNRNASAGSLRGRASIRGNLFAYVNINKYCQPVFKSIYEENLTVVNFLRICFSNLGKKI